MREAVWVGIGGFFGAIARFAVAGWVQNRTNGFPYGTLTVNLIGSFLLGFLAMFLLERTGTATFRLVVLVGFLGAFTTFSTFSYETAMLAEDGRWRAVAANIVLNVLLCLVGTVLGFFLARWVTR